MIHYCLLHVNGNNTNVLKFNEINHYVYMHSRV